jgi:hypothetical protein
MVEPFTDALVSLEENFFPGAPSAASASLLWAQNYDHKGTEYGGNINYNCKQYQIHCFFCSYTGRLLLENIFSARSSS